MRFVPEDDPTYSDVGLAPLCTRKRGIGQLHRARECEKERFERSEEIFEAKEGAAESSG